MTCRPFAVVVRAIKLTIVSATLTTTTAPGAPTGSGKRGPTPPVSDADLVTEIRAVLAASPFHGEGYRKVRVRLAHRVVRVSGKRVLRLMRAQQLLAPRRLGPPNGNPAHDGTIITDRPNEMWGTDATRFYTEQDGWCWFFVSTRGSPRRPEPRPGRAAAWRIS